MSSCVTAATRGNARKQVAKVSTISKNNIYVHARPMDSNPLISTELLQPSNLKFFHTLTYLTLTTTNISMNMY